MQYHSFHKFIVAWITFVYVWQTAKSVSKYYVISMQILGIYIINLLVVPAGVFVSLLIVVSMTLSASVRPNGLVLETCTEKLPLSNSGEILVMNCKVATVIRSVIRKKPWKCSSNRFCVKILVTRSCCVYQLK